MKHISINIEELLNLTDKKLGSIFLTSGRAARKQLETELIKGNRFIRSESCEKFDPKEGCKCR